MIMQIFAMPLISYADPVWPSLLRGLLVFSANANRRNASVKLMCRVEIHGKAIVIRKQKGERLVVQTVLSRTMLSNTLKQQIMKMILNIFWCSSDWS